MAETKEKPQKIRKLSITNDDDMKVLSEDLQKFVKDKKASQNIQGKDYVNVEAWQYVGSRLNIFPRATDVQILSTDEELKAAAKVELWDMEANVLVGSGFALCSNKEQGKKYYQEFAIYSMAQTRATSKAYRIVFGFLMKMAGFEATPAEEMDYQGNDEGASVKHQKELAKKAPAKAVGGAAPNQPAINTTTVEGAGEPIVLQEGQHPITEVQKKAIIKLLENPVIPRDMKTKMLLGLGKMDTERAATATTNIKNFILENGGKLDGESSLTSTQK